MIYIDMDGCLARWNQNASVQETHAPGYFLSREPENVLFSLVQRLVNSSYEITVLSSVYPDGTAALDKERWLRAQGLSNIPRIFVPYGKDKHLYVKKDPSNILIDDYSENLRSWEKAGYRGIKFYNGINGTHGTWKGCSIRHDMSPEQMFRIVTSAEP